MRSEAVRAGWTVVLVAGWMVSCGTEASDDAGQDAGANDVGTGDTTPSACAAPNPAGCRAEGCPSGSSCIPTGEPGCMPSICSCDEDLQTWACTADCGPIVACVEDSPTPGACLEPDPRGCRAEGCPSGLNCIPVDTPGCTPSECTCVDGGWACTDDCLPVHECLDLPLPQPCGPDIRSCMQTGCPNGEVCAPTGDLGCMASSCSCDEASGAWQCTADCGPIVACVPIELNERLCSTPNPAGCAATGCPYGQRCIETGDTVCRPSTCVCEPDEDVWGCTRDCRPDKACVAEEDLEDPAPTPGCEGPNPAGCPVTGCPDGQRCEPSDDDGCRPGTCFCDDTSGVWTCTADCQAMAECVAR
jgi:hypothetical protein